MRRPPSSTPALSGAGHSAAITLLKAGAALSGMASPDRPGRPRHAICDSVLAVPRRIKANDILRRELDAQCRPQRAEAECAQVLVEIAHPRRQGKHPQHRRVQSMPSAPSHRRHRRRGRCRADAAPAGAEGRQGGWPRAPQPSAWQAAHSAATASSRSPRARTSLAAPKRTAWPSRSPIARRSVSIGALPSVAALKPSGSS